MRTCWRPDRLEPAGGHVHPHKFRLRTKVLQTPVQSERGRITRAPFQRRLKRAFGARVKMQEPRRAIEYQQFILVHIVAELEQRDTVCMKLQVKPVFLFECQKAAFREKADMRVIVFVVPVFEWDRSTVVMLRHDADPPARFDQG